MEAYSRKNNSYFQLHLCSDLFSKLRGQGNRSFILMCSSSGDCFLVNFATGGVEGGGRGGRVEKMGRGE